MTFKSIFRLVILGVLALPALSQAKAPPVIDGFVFQEEDSGITLYISKTPRAVPGGDTLEYSTLTLMSAMPELTPGGPRAAAQLGTQELNCKEALVRTKTSSYLSKNASVISTENIKGTWMVNWRKIDVNGTSGPSYAFRRYCKKS